MAIKNNNVVAFPLLFLLLILFCVPGEAPFEGDESIVVE